MFTVGGGRVLGFSASRIFSGRLGKPATNMVSGLGFLVVCMGLALEYVPMCFRPTLNPKPHVWVQKTLSPQIPNLPQPKSLRPLTLNVSTPQMPSSQTFTALSWLHCFDDPCLRSVAINS